MFLLKIAFANILFHKKRSFLSILLIAVACCTILLYKGYVEYSERGLALSFIENSGHIQVACKGFWSEKTEDTPLLTASDIEGLKGYFFEISKIEKVDAILNFQGIIGRGNASKIFWGIAYDEPHLLGVTEGVPVFEEDNSLVLGMGLFNALDINLENNNIVNLMTTISSNELNSGSFEVAGYIDSGVPQNDRGLIIASRHALLNFFELDDKASCLRLYLESERDVEQIQKILNSYFEKNNLSFETRDWKTLNPTYTQISSLFNTQFSVITFILCVLIFVSLSQSIGMSFMERLSEFGTMEAIGLKKINLIFSLLMEVFILSFVGIILGIIFAYLGNVITETGNITMTPPGYSKGFPLRFFITVASLFKTLVFILLTCLVATLQPVYAIGKFSTVHLMQHSEK